MRGNINQIDEAVKLLQKKLGPATSNAMSTYKRLVKLVLEQLLLWLR